MKIYFTSSYCWVNKSLVNVLSIRCSAPPEEPLMRQTVYSQIAMRLKAGFAGREDAGHAALRTKNPQRFLV